MRLRGQDGFNLLWCAALAALMVAHSGCMARSQYTISRVQLRAALDRVSNAAGPIGIPARDEDGVFKALDARAFEELGVAELVGSGVTEPGLIQVTLDDYRAYRRRVGWSLVATGVAFVLPSTVITVDTFEENKAIPAPLWTITGVLLSVGIGYLIAAVYSGPETGSVLPGLPEDPAWFE